MLEQIQLIAGAGDICRSRFDGRVYEYNGEVRGSHFNRGVDPGSPVSVLLFKLFMNTDVALTGLNPDILWAAAYSDDRAAIASADQILNGEFQAAQTSSNDWAVSEGCEYHASSTSDGKPNPKGPKILEYRLKGMNSILSENPIHLGHSQFVLTDGMRELGLNVSTDSNVLGSKKYLDRRGYFFRPELSKLASLAYRIQSLKYRYPPNFIRKIVQSYFGGIMRFGSCLYYNRAIESDLDRARFYYVMACSAILKITAIDVVRGSCCKFLAVKEDNKYYLKLLEMVGLSSLREMAMIDSVSTTRQVALLKPELFVDNSSSGRPKRTRRGVQRLGVVDKVVNSDFSSEVSELGLPSTLSRDVIVSSALIGDVCRMAWEFAHIPAPVKESTEFPYEYFFRLSKKCHEEDVGEVNYVEILAVFQKLCLSEFNALDPQDRRFNFITPTKRPRSLMSCRVSPPLWFGTRDKKQTSKLFFSCYHSPPKVSEEIPRFVGLLDWEKSACGGCGYRVTSFGSSSFSCVSCSRQYHRVCVEELALPKSTLCCKMVKRHLGKDGSELLEPVFERRERPILRDKMCLVCGGDTRDVCDVISCSLSCGYGVHDYCLALMKHVSRSLDPAFEYGVSFTCSDVIYQLKPAEVEDCVNFVRGRVSRSRPATTRWRFVSRYVKALIKILKRRGKVQVKSYGVRDKRWENDDYFCTYCKSWIGINEYDHYESWCKGISGTPVSSSESVYIRSRCKRFRHMIRAETVI